MKVGRLLHEFGEKVALFGQIRTNCTNFTPDLSQTEVDYVQLRSRDRIVAEIATIPGEIYPELTNGGITRYPGADFPGALFEPILRTHLKSRYQFVLGLGNDELGYLIPKAEWDDQPPWLLNRPQRWYGEINSVGPDVAGVLLRGLVWLTEQR